MDAVQRHLVNKVHRQQPLLPQIIQEQGQIMTFIPIQKERCQKNHPHMIISKNPRFMLKLIILKRCNIKAAIQMHRLNSNRIQQRCQTVHQHRMHIKCITQQTL